MHVGLGGQCGRWCRLDFLLAAGFSPSENCWSPGWRCWSLWRKLSCRAVGLPPDLHPALRLIWGYWISHPLLLDEALGTVRPLVRTGFDFEIHNCRSSSLGWFGPGKPQYYFELQHLDWSINFESDLWDEFVAHLDEAIDQGRCPLAVLSQCLEDGLYPMTRMQLHLLVKVANPAYRSLHICFVGYGFFPFDCLIRLADFDW